MGNIQYKSSGTWTDVPAAALTGTFAGGGPTVERPEYPDRDGNGAPCGAIGQPRIVLRTSRMSGTGFAHWMGRYAAGGTDYQTAWDREASSGAGAWTGWGGTLLRPRGVEHLGSTAAKTYYSDVEIIIEGCTASVWTGTGASMDFEEADNSMYLGAVL